jgi:hypothetical protein
MRIVLVCISLVQVGKANQVLILHLSILAYESTGFSHLSHLNSSPGSLHTNQDYP